MSFKKMCAVVLFAFIVVADSVANVPTVRAGSMRLGSGGGAAVTSGQVKAAPANGAVGGINANRLWPNLVQPGGGVTGGSVSAGTSSNSAIDSVRKDIQMLQQQMESELDATRQQMDDLQAEIEKKNDRIAELEDMLADYGQIQESVKNIPEVIKSEIDSKGLVTTKNMATEIERAKQVAVRDARSVAISTVQGMGFVTQDAVAAAESRMNNTIAASVAQVKSSMAMDAGHAAMAAVQGMGFATNAAVMAAESRMNNAIADAKEQVASERNVALQQYAKHTDVASGIATAKNAVMQDMVKHVADKKFATKDELSNLELAVDGDAIAKIVDNRLHVKKVISEDSQAFVDVKGTLQALPSVYAKSEAVNGSIEQMNARIADNANAIVAEAANRVAAIKELDTDMSGRINAEISKESSARVAAIAGLGDTFATKSALSDVDKKFNNISGTIADDLLADEQFTGQILAGLDENIKELPTAVETLAGRVAAAEGDIAAESSARVAAIAGLGDTFATKTALAGVSGQVGNLGDNIQTLTANVAANAANITKESNARVAAIAGLGDTFATKTALSDVDKKFDDIGDTIADGLLADEQFTGQILAGMDEGIKNLPAAVETLAGRVAAAEGDIAAESSARVAAIAGLGDTFATKSALSDVDKKFNNISGTIADDLLADEQFTGQILAGMDEGIKNLPAAVADLNERFDGIAGNLLSDATFKGQLLDGYVTNTKLNEFGGKFVLQDSFDNAIAGLDDTFATNERVDGIAGGLAEDSEFKRKIWIGLDDTFAKKEAFNDYTKTNELESFFAGKFVKVGDIDAKVQDAADDLAEDETFKRKIWIGLDDTFAKKESFNDYTKTNELESFFAGKFVKVGDIDSKIQDAADDLAEDSEFKRKIWIGLDDTFAMKDSVIVVGGQIKDIMGSIESERLERISAFNDLDGKYANVEDLGKVRDKLNSVEGDILGNDNFKLAVAAEVDGKFVKPDALTAFVRADQFAGKLSEHNSTIAGNLQGDASFKNNLFADMNATMAGLNTEVVALKGRVAAAEGGIAANASGIEAEGDAREDALAGLDKVFVKPDALTAFVRADQFAGKLSEHNSTIAGNLQGDASFKNNLFADMNATMAGLNTEVVALKGRVAAAEGGIAANASGIEAEGDAREDALAGLDKVFVKPDALRNYVSSTNLDSRLSEYTKTNQMENTLTGKFVKSATLNDYVTNTKLNEFSGTIADNLLDNTTFKGQLLDGYATTNNLVTLNNQVLQLSGNISTGLATERSARENAISGLANTYVKLTDFTPVKNTVDAIPTTYALQSQVESLETQVSQNTNNITLNTNKVSALETDVGTLETDLETTNLNLNNLDSTVKKFQINNGGNWELPSEP